MTELLVMDSREAKDFCLNYVCKSCKGKLIRKFDFEGNPMYAKIICPKCRKFIHVDEYEIPKERNGVK